MFKRMIFGSLLFLLILAGTAGGAYYYLVQNSNPFNYKTVGSISVPNGFQRVPDNSFASYLRDFPLKSRGEKVQLYTGGDANYQLLSYAVIDMPLLNNWEQCADVCIRLNAEYLYQKQQYGQIAYKDVNGKLMTYTGGANRKAFENYLNKVYGMASTYSLSKFLPSRKLNELQPGDVFVYPARKGAKYGHAVIVVDVAVNSKTGERAFLLAEGNTPARSIHLLRNYKRPFSTPWFVVDGNEQKLLLGPFVYYPNEIRHF